MRGILAAHCSAAILLASSCGATDCRPALIAARPGAAETALQKRSRLEKTALRQLRDASQAVKESAHAYAMAQRQLSDARRRARDAHDRLAKLQRLPMSGAADAAAVTQHERRLLAGRVRVLCCLFGFTFMNGLARRSLSSAAPSLVGLGLIGYPYIEHVFMVGFEVFVLGKILAVPTLLLLGTRASLLLQVAVMGASCAWYLAAPTAAAMHGWIIFRIFSAMAVSTVLPFVGAWFPRAWYGRIFALLFTGFQAGYLTCSYYWGHLLSHGQLHWTIPLAQCAAGFALLFGASALWLRERPPPPPAGSRAAQAAAKARGERADTSDAPMRKLMHKLSTRWVFWAMVVACAAYSPAVEYSTHVTSYLKEMTSPHLRGGAAAKGSPEGGFVCLQSRLCEGRYRGYVASYVASLLVGSFLYDRASQLDRAFLVVGLLLINTCCWLALALAEPDAPAPAWVKATGGAALSLLRRLRARALTRASAAGMPAPILTLSAPFKTTITALAGATIALPSSLPFAIFSIDFGKEGAAVLSSIIQVVGSLAALLFLRGFPAILRQRGWFGVHAILSFLGVTASVAMGAIMFADSQKFARGYVIRSSLLNETVVTLHACTRPECTPFPMWRPGQRRLWGPAAGSHMRPYAPSGLCHLCSRGDRLVECSVDEAAAAAAVRTPFDECGGWVRAEKPLRKPKEGWAFAHDPTFAPLAAMSSPAPKVDQDGLEAAVH